MQIPKHDCQTRQHEVLSHVLFPRFLKACPPPVLFQELVDEVLESEYKEIMHQLVNAKMQITM